MLDEYIASFVSLQEPWWVYALALLLPLSVLLCLREMWCWFFKLNKLINRLERVERAINNLGEAVSREQSVAPAKSSSPPAKPEAHGGGSDESLSLKRGPSEL